MSSNDIHKWAHSLARAMLQAVREKDPYTYGHCMRVARNAKLLAEAAGLPEKDQLSIEFASLFHDLGKMGIPDSILLKPGRLTPEEADIMRLHPVKSAEIVQPLTEIDFFKKTLPGILSHHERIDGLGYPHGLEGNTIPLEARVIVIVDTFDAMTSTRPYRKALPREIAYKELLTFSGRQFDPDLVKVFLKAHPHWQEFNEEITDEFLATEYRKVA